MANGDVFLSKDQFDEFKTTQKVQFADIHRQLGILEGRMETLSKRVEAQGLKVAAFAAVGAAVPVILSLIVLFQQLSEK